MKHVIAKPAPDAHQLAAPSFTMFCEDDDGSQYAITRIREFKADSITVETDPREPGRVSVGFVFTADLYRVRGPTLQRRRT